jgi:hypothetical protein
VRPYTQTEQGDGKPRNLPSPSKSSPAIDVEIKPVVAESTTFKNKYGEFFRNLDKSTKQGRAHPLRK